MGQANTVQKCNFEDIQNLYNKDKCLLINTLPISEQSCLINNTIDYKDEEERLNNIIKKGETSKYYVLIYGKNTNDMTVLKKYQQLLSLGFIHVYIYCGGMFEWLCLQDIYGEDEFQTSQKELDILKYKSYSIQKNNLIEDGVL